MLHIDEYGRVREWVDQETIADMLAPVQCKFCHHVHDAGRVTVIQRYADCSVWKCPKCKATLDDRPEGWGGSAIPIER